MLRVIATFLLLIGSISLSQEQEADTLIYDAPSGNYIVRYTTTLPFAQRTDGTLRRLYIEDSLQGGESYIEVDTIITVIWEPPTKVEPTISCFVEPCQESDRRFSYRVTNGVGSRQKVMSLLVEFGQGTQPRSQSENGWLNRQVYEPGAEQLANRWGWMAAGQGASPLSPGDSLSGFNLISSGLPGIGLAYMDGVRTQITEFPGGGPRGNTGSQLQRLKTFPKSYVARTTIVPVTPSDLFVPLAFLDTLISYKHQAFELGWIKEEGIVTSLDAKLEAARPQIINDRPSAKNILESFVNELDALNTQGDQITSEAYALLKFNAQYLISKL